MRAGTTRVSRYPTFCGRSFLDYVPEPDYEGDAEQVGAEYSISVSIMQRSVHNHHSSFDDPRIDRHLMCPTSVILGVRAATKASKYLTALQANWNAADTKPVFFSNDIFQNDVAEDFASSDFFYLNPQESALHRSVSFHQPKAAFTQLATKASMAQAYLPQDLARHLASFVQTIQDQVDDFLEDGIEPQPASINGLFAFMISHLWIRPPSLMLTKDGLIAAFWDKDRSERIRLDFVNLARVKWVVVRDKEALSGRGEITLDGLDGIIEAYGAKEWMSR